MRHSKKLTAGLGVVTTGILATGIAFAAWTSQGTGTGSAASGTSADSTITAVAPVAADNLYPGAVKSTKVTINNPNPYPIEVTQIAGGYSRSVGSPACDAGSVWTDALGTGAAALAKDGGGTTIPAQVGATPGTATYTLTVRMANDASDNCKTQTFVLGGTAGTGAGNIVATIRSAASTVGN
jgi:hypothetical protein